MRGGVGAYIADFEYGTDDRRPTRHTFSLHNAECAYSDILLALVGVGFLRHFDDPVGVVQGVAIV